MRFGNSSTIPVRFYTKVQFHKLSAMDVLARTTMKDAANCDTQCELQNSVNHQTAERKRRRWGFFLAARLFQCFCIVTNMGLFELCFYNRLATIRFDLQQVLKKCRVPCCGFERSTAREG